MNEITEIIRAISLFVILIASSVSVWILRKSFWIRFQAPLAFSLFQITFALMVFSLIALLTGGIHFNEVIETRSFSLIMAEVLLAFASAGMLYSLVFWHNGIGKSP